MDATRGTLENKAILVSGGTTGIGRALAKQLVGEGAKVMIFGRHEKELNDALTDIQPEGNGKDGKVVGMVADQAIHDDVLNVFDRTDKEFGKLDILVNNAALPASKISDSDYDEWRYVVESNLLGYMDCCRCAVDRMRPNKAGHIVNIGSMSADAEDPNNVYVATKAGVRGFTKSLAKELNKDGIRVTVIEPGLVGTDMTQEVTDQQEQWQGEGKMLKAEDIADCVIYALKQPDRCDVEFIQIRPRMEKE
jgi:NADP-dependent 3-hydroxy acid dehydrogenase YdfG